MRTGEGTRVGELATFVQSHYGFLPDYARLALFGILCGDLDLSSIIESGGDQQRLVLTELFEQAAEEQVLSLLWLKTEATLRRIDTELHESIRQHVERRRMWNRIGALSAAELYSSLQENHIQARVFKGALLSQELYGDAFARDTRDIDVIVARNHLSSAVDLMLSQGYKCQVSQAAFESERFLKSFRQASFRKLRGAIEVDLHWKLCNDWLDCDKDFEAELFESSTTITVGGRELPWFDKSQLVTIAQLNLANSHTVDLKATIDLMRLQALPLRLDNLAELRSQLQYLASKSILKEGDVASDLFATVDSAARRGAIRQHLRTWQRNVSRVSSVRGAISLCRIAFSPRIRSY